MLLVAQHTFGQWERCKTHLLGSLKMPRNLTVFIQCLITQANLLSDSQNSLPLASQSCSWCPTEVLHLVQAELPANAQQHEAGGMSKAPWLSPWALGGHSHDEWEGHLILGRNRYITCPSPTPGWRGRLNSQGFCYNAEEREMRLWPQYIAGKQAELQVVP